MTARKRMYSRQQQAPGAKEKTEHLAHQKPRSSKQEEEELLLPHDRDETTGSESTASATVNQESRDMIKQAADDIESGLKDTERRGIPSDVPAGTDKKQRKR